MLPMLKQNNKVKQTQHQHWLYKYGSMQSKSMFESNAVHTLAPTGHTLFLKVFTHALIVFHSV